MRHKLRNYFIGEHMRTDDVFEQARAVMLYEFLVIFFLIFSMPLVSEIQSGYYKAVILHGTSEFFLLITLILFKRSRNLTSLINFFFLVWFIASVGSSMILSPIKLDPLIVAWTVASLALGTLLLRGMFRWVYCCFLGWLPVIYIYLNIMAEGKITWHTIVQPNVSDTPMFVLLIPIAICVYAIWSHTKTIERAKLNINQQKQTILEKNRSVENKQKEILDSIRYARRIQASLLPTEKYIEKIMNTKR